MQFYLENDAHSHHPDSVVSGGGATVAPPDNTKILGAQEVAAVDRLDRIPSQLIISDRAGWCFAGIRDHTVNQPPTSENGVVRGGATVAP